MKTPVLMYHEITDRPVSEIPVEERPYAITNVEFDQQVAFLIQQGITTRFVNADQPNGGRSAVITFDDGHASDVFAALPRLLNHGLKAEFYITTGWIGKPGYVSRADIRELAAAGMVLGTHGVTHRYFDDLTEAELRLELLDSKSALEDIVGQGVFGGSAPGGRIHSHTQQIASNLGYRYLCVSNADLADLRPAGEFQFVPRFAVNRNMPLEKYSRLASGDRRTVFLQNARTTMLSYAKRALGNRNYEVLRRRLLSGKKVD